MRNTQAMVTYTQHLLHYNNGKDDDPCDDWSGLPIPKTKEDTND
jgi:hypothetical protein